jgi:chorismate synthase
LSSIWGENIKISVFGESHGEAIGVVVDGLPPGIKLDIDKINLEMDRRKPGQNAYTTQRKEGDRVEIVSGFFNGFTTGTPLCGIIRNTDKRSVDYDKIKSIMRPSHADYTGRILYKGFGDYRGGGHFSGRLTAPVVFAGAIAYQYLEQAGITIGTHLLKIGEIEDIRIDPVNISAKELISLRHMHFPVINKDVGENMKKVISDAKTSGDSVGGVLETSIINLPEGLGSPMFQSVESRLSSFIFSIPAVKGIEFGAGFGFTDMSGFEANDSFYIEGDKVKTKTNHSGGINGGITNGMPVIFRTAMRPTPSIAKMQQTIDADTMTETEFSVHGRHDPCIALRAVPVLDAAAAIVILDLCMKKEG